MEEGTTEVLKHEVDHGTQLLLLKYGKPITLQRTACSSRIDDMDEMKPDHRGFQEVHRSSCRNFLDVLVVYDCSKTTLSGVSLGCFSSAESAASSFGTKPSGLYWKDECEEESHLSAGLKTEIQLKIW